uniref:Uncharacterized protein n=1 Tax=Siphoviridae sp. ct6d71 TaxID=2826298 RepID=A0A8S5R3A0_9CAUD|nr:MAG TPA: hypothetical protein [Siphoviridae sp. ct6d71]
MLSIVDEGYTVSQRHLPCGLTIYPYLFYNLLVNYSKPLSMLP